MRGPVFFFFFFFFFLMLKAVVRYGERVYALMCVHVYVKKRERERESWTSVEGDMITYEFRKCDSACYVENGLGEGKAYCGSCRKR